MSFWWGRYAELHVHNGSVLRTKLNLMDGTDIKELGMEQMYKYLGLNQFLSLNILRCKKQLNSQKCILKTKLKFRKKIIAMNTWVIPSVVILKQSRASREDEDVPMNQ